MATREEILGKIRGALANDAAEKIAETLRSVQLNAGVKGEEKNFRLGFRPGELTDALLDSALPRLDGIPIVVERAPGDAAAAKPDELESISASLIPAELLLADTGSAVVRSASAFDRLMNYLSPVCLSARIAGDGERTGEFLLMTGPSRTADIEKILILGVHGPKKVVVYIVENE